MIRKLIERAKRFVQSATKIGFAAGAAGLALFASPAPAPIAFAGGIVQLPAIELTAARAGCAVATARDERNVQVCGTTDWAMAPKPVVVAIKGLCDTSGVPFMTDAMKTFYCNGQLFFAKQPAVDKIVSPCSTLPFEGEDRRVARCSAQGWRAAPMS